MTRNAATITHTTAIARVLRGLGLKQGADFRVRGEYVRGERRGTAVVALNRNAEAVIAGNARHIESATDEMDRPFRVNIYNTPSGGFFTITNSGTGPGHRPAGVIDLLAHL